MEMKKMERGSRDVNKYQSRSKEVEKEEIGKVDNYGTGRRVERT